MPIIIIIMTSYTQYDHIKQVIKYGKIPMATKTVRSVLILSHNVWNRRLTIHSCIADARLKKTELAER